MYMIAATITRLEVFDEIEYVDNRLPEMKLTTLHINYLRKELRKYHNDC